MGNYIYKDKNGNILPLNNFTANKDDINNAILELINNGTIIVPGVSQDDVISAVKRLSPLYNLKWVQIGDSNTQYMSADLGEYVKEHHYIKSYTNMGTAGQTWETSNGVDTTDNSAVGRVNSLIANADTSTHLCSDYDIITIMMGTNCRTVGTINDTSSQVDTMCGAVKYCLEKLCCYYRNAKIGVILPAQRAEVNEEQKTRNDLIKQICVQYSIPTLDMYTEGRIIPDYQIKNLAKYEYLSDGLHYGAVGKAHYYRIVGSWLERI